MRRILMAALVAVAIVILAIADVGFCRDKGNLYNIFCKKAVVKVFMPAITNSTGENKIDTTDLKEQLKDALDNRKSINFEVVSIKENAEITIECDISKFYWSEDDPVDMIFGAGPLAYDLLTTQNYAYLEATFTVTDIKKNEGLWGEKLRVDLTQENMNEQESIPLINKKTVKAFIKRCFSKKYSNR